MSTEVGAIHSGLWRLSGKWSHTGGISADIWNELQKEVNGRDSIAIKSGRREKKIKLSDGLLESMRTQVFSKLTFLFALFTYLIETEQGENDPAEEFSAEHEVLQLILDIIGIAPLKERFQDALTYFKSEIFCSNFDPTTLSNEIKRLKNGSFLLTSGPTDGEEFVAIAWERPSLHHLTTFLQKVGKIENPTIMPIFSPEEEVFEPYFTLLGMVVHKLVKQPHLRPLFEKAVSNFGESNYTDSISAIGLAAEDILTQIYETLFREQLTKGLTLGQLVDEIQNRISALHKKKEDLPPNLSALFSDINSALGSGKSDVSTSLEVTRKLLAILIENNKLVTAKIDRIGKPERRVGLFPERTTYATTELIRYRNAASHKSRVPIGPYECKRAAYSLVVLLKWWEDEKRAIDWTRSPNDIVKECVIRNSKGMAVSD